MTEHQTGYAPEHGRADAPISAAAAFDWSRSELGPRAAWPPCLQLTVDIMLNSPLAMLLMWGPQQIMVFNDAYAALCGPSTLRAPGARVPSMQPAAWSWSSAAIETAWQGRSARYLGQTLPLWRDGGPQPQQLDLYYTPIRDPGAAVAGILCALAPVAAPAPAPSQALRILVVEDHPDAQYLVCEMLRALGHQVQAVDRGEDALPALAQQRYDVLFSDVSLPGMSGVELARLARARQPGLQVMFASGYGESLTRQLEFPAATLQKPYDIEQLQAALDQLVLRLQARAP